MNAKATKQLIELNEQLSFIDLEIDNQVKKCENAIEIILKSINLVKRIITKNTFKSDLDEIHFFKEVKPQFTSKLIYYNMIYKIEMKRPNGGNRILKKYYHNELLKLKSFFDNELEFYQYYRSSSTYLRRIKTLVIFTRVFCFYYFFVFYFKLPILGIPNLS